MEDDNQVVVIDMGTASCKAGITSIPLSGVPSRIIPTILGRPKVESILFNNTQVCFGVEAMRRRPICHLSYPMVNSQVVNWDEMKKFCSYICQFELRIEPEYHPFLLADHPNATRSSREKITQIMFEDFNVPLLFMANQGTCAMLGSNRNTGVVVQCGEGSTVVVPIYEGSVITHAIRSLEIGGSHITEALLRGVRQENRFIPLNLGIGRAIKEKRAYVAHDFDKELEKFSTSYQKKTCILPDEQIIDVGAEMFTATEILFQPSMIGLISPGLPEFVKESILACDPSIHNLLFSNIVTAGGTANLPGLQKRLVKEIEAIEPGLVIGIVTEKDPIVSTWRGAERIATSAGFINVSISKQEYDDAGPSIVHRKCF